MAVAAADRSTNTADAAVVDIFDAIGADWFGEGITAASVSRSLLQARDAKEIVVRVNSPGGDVFDGTAIYNLLRAERTRVRVEVVGLAASMASVVALAGHRVVMHANAMMMIHNPWSIVVGDANEARRSAEMLDKIRDSMLTVYEANSHLDRDTLIAMLDAETWLTAEEALQHGFIDEVLPAANDEAPQQAAAARVAAVLSKFSRTPAAVCARYGDRRVAAQPQRKAKSMERSELLALLGLPADASDEQIKASLQGSKAPAPAAPVDLSAFVPRADYDALRSSLAAREAAEKEQQRRAFEARVEASVEQAVKAGKIPPVSADYHRSTCLSGGVAALDAFESYVAKAPELVGSAQIERQQRREAASPVSAEDRKIIARLGVTAEELEAARADMRDKPEIYPTEAYPEV